jgi:hypothetical protein
MALTPEMRSQRARIAALTRWAKENPTPNAQRGQRGLVDKFLAQVDATAAAAGETLTEAERARRADAAYRAHMARLSYASAKQSDSGMTSPPEPSAEPTPSDRHRPADGRQ